MCNLLLDVEIERDVITLDTDDVTPVTCTSGRVIIAATAYVGAIGSSTTAVPVRLADGAPVDTVELSAWSTAAQATYMLTTARVVDAA